MSQIDNINIADHLTRLKWCILIFTILDLEIPAPPLPPPMDCMDGFEDIPPLPPPVDYDSSAPVEYLEKGAL